MVGSELTMKFEILCWYLEFTTCFGLQSQASTDLILNSTPAYGALILSGSPFQDDFGDAVSGETGPTDYNFMVIFMLDASLIRLAVDGFPYSDNLDIITLLSG